MALVVFLRGVNVGGYRTFRPAVLAKELDHLGAVNIGAAGTFVFRRPVTAAELRAELASRLPFEAQMAICQGRDLARLIASDPFSEGQEPKEIIRFVAVLCARPRSKPELPASFPSAAKWVMQLLGRQGPFVFGRYRRQMNAIRYLDSVDDLFGVPATTRNWNTIQAIGKVLGERRQS